MYLLQQRGQDSGFFPINTKWAAGSSAIFSRKQSAPTAGPFYARRGLGRMGMGQDEPIDVSYSDLPTTLTPPADFTPLVLVPSSAGETTSIDLPSTLIPPAPPPISTPIFNLAPAASIAPIVSSIAPAASIATSVQKMLTPTLAPRSPAMFAPGVAAAGVLPGVSNNTLLLLGGMILLLTVVSGLGRKR